jgi:hypothetical protein
MRIIVIMMVILVAILALSVPAEAGIPACC